jgi:hypothetical protein
MMPIESAFSKAKAWLRRNREISKRNPRVALKRALFSVSADDAAGYYRRCGWNVLEILPRLYL